MNSPKTIVITGASGFIGSVLVDHFSSRGWKVVACMRNIPSAQKVNVTFVTYDLSGAVDPAIFENACCLIHAAYIKSDARNPDAYALNLKGAEVIIEASRKAGVRKNIFISSMSAYDDALSIYGKQKFAIEKLFRGENDVVVRPGLVIGDGGLAKNIIRMLRNGRIIPLIGGGNQPLQIIAIDDLVQAVGKIIEKDLKGAFTLAHPDAYTFRSFYKIIGAHLGVKQLFISVPYFLPRMFMRFASLLNLPLMVTEDNLRGLQKMRYADTVDDLAKVGIDLKNLEQALRKIHPH